MFESVMIANARDEHALSLMAGVLHEWEPALELYVAFDNAMIFEPDGTLYAVCLSAASLAFRHHRRSARVGDGLVIPQGVTIDAEPGIDLVCVRHEGIPPFHFRERFIQGVGFEHIQRTASIAEGWVTLDPVTDVRHRLPFTALASDLVSVRCEASVERVQLVVISHGAGQLTVEPDQASRQPSSFALTAGDLILVPPGRTIVLSGPLEAMRLQGLPEIVHEARLLHVSEEKGVEWSPESFRRSD